MMTLTPTTDPPRSPIRAVLYLRYSSDRQNPRSIADQERQCREWATKNGYTVTAIYADEALSGATTDRPKLERMLEDANSGRFAAVIYDDQSRIARNLEDYLRLVRLFLARGVELIDRARGQSSRDPSTRLQRILDGHMHEQYLEDLRDKTMRGLTGRALAGCHTGGRCYGYRTEEIPNPADPKHPSFRLVIDPTEADILRHREFEAFAAGASPREIADALNRDGIAAPYDGKGYAKRAGRGWSSGTVRAHLRNERYIGIYFWNRRHWVLDAESRKHRAHARPESEWVPSNCPAIIDRALWDRVQLRLGPPNSKGTTKTRQHAGRRPSPLSGMLICGVSGHGMQISGQAKGKYRNFKCAANHSKGAAICQNSATISENKALAALAAAINDLTNKPSFCEALFQRFSETFTKRLTERSKAQAEQSPAADLESQIRKQEGSVRNFANAVERHAERHGYSETLSSRLAEAEATLTTLRTRRAALPPRAPPSGGALAPSPALLRAMFDDVAQALAGDPVQVNMMLRARFAPIVLTPMPDEWRMKTALKVEPAALVAQSGRKVFSEGVAGTRRRYFLRPRPR